MGICGPTGSLACTLISAFGSIFLAVLAILIQNDYPFLGEWYIKDMPYPEQRDKAAHGAWLICAVYGILAIVCAVIFTVHNHRAPGYQKM
jgi:hypothetical protein